LVEASRDSVAWFSIVAAESYTRADLIGYFGLLSEQRRGFGHELEALIRDAGYRIPNSSRRVLARAWRDTLSLLGRDVNNLSHRLASTTPLEERCLAEYHTALILPWAIPIRAVLQKQADTVARVCERIATLMMLS
jgi:hypothetical protein